MSGEDGLLFAGCDSDRRRSGIVFARLGVGITIRIVSEFAEHPGAEHITDSWLGQVDDSVRMLFKTLRQSGFELFELPVQLSEDPHCCFGRCRKGGGHGGGCSQLSAAESGLDF